MSISSVLMPQECLLCGGDGDSSPLCEPCGESLPTLPAPRCPVCAGPGVGLCGSCLKEPPAYDATFAHWRYGFPLDQLVQSLKYRHALALAGFFARAMMSGPRPAGDVMVPVPLSPARLRERGFNQAVEIAKPLASALGVPLDLDACARTLDTAAQAGLPWKERKGNVKSAFECVADLSGKAVIVVDDVMTSGATLDEFARTLKRGGAASVTNWIVARALRD